MVMIKYFVFLFFFVSPASRSDRRASIHSLETVEVNLDRWIQIVFWGTEELLLSSHSVVPRLRQ